MMSRRAMSSRAMWAKLTLFSLLNCVDEIALSDYT